MALSDLIQQTPTPTTGTAGGSSEQSSGYSGNLDVWRPSVEEYAASRDETYVPDLSKYNPYAEGTPQNVQQVYSQFQDVQYATQDFANEWQQNIINDYNGYKTDENYQGKLSQYQTEQLYDALSNKYETNDYTAWGTPKPEDEIFSNIIPNYLSAQQTERAALDKLETPIPTDQDKVYESVLGKYAQTQEQKDFMNARNLETGDYNLATGLTKAQYNSLASGIKVEGNEPWYSKYLQGIFPSLMSAGVGAKLGSLVGQPVLGAVIVGGLTYIQSVTDIQIPVINQFLEAFDAGEHIIKQTAVPFVASYSYVKENSSSDATAWNLLKEAGEYYKDNLESLRQLGELGYYASADFGVDDTMLFLRNAGASISNSLFGTDIEQRSINQVTRSNLLRNGLEEVNSETQGLSNLIEVYQPLFEGFVTEYENLGYTHNNAVQMARGDMEDLMARYFGTTGQFRDLVAGSTLDLANIAPYAEGKAVESYGKSVERYGNITKNQSLIDSGKSLVDAAKAANGNPILDMLPPVVQQGVELALSPIKTGNNTPDLLKTHTSSGMDVIRATYAKDVQATKSVDLMSPIEKRFVGVTSEGKLKGYEPLSNTGNKLKDWLKNASRLTAESMVLDLSQMATEFVGSIFFDSRLSNDQIPTVIKQIAGKEAIPVDSPLAKFQNTAVFNTLKDGFAGISDKQIQKISYDVENFRKYNTNRAVVAEVAKNLKITEREVLDGVNGRKTGVDYKSLSKKERKALTEKTRNEFLERVRQAGITFEDQVKGKTLDTESVIKSIDAFRNKDRLYSTTYFKADIMDQLNKAADDYHLKQYNITPDSWAVRVSELSKSVQSVALLNFSPSYLVNNFLNNMLTRSALGIGGVDFDFQRTANDLRGIQFARLETDAEGNKTAWQKTKDAISKEKKPKSDNLEKIKKLYHNFTDENTIIGKVLKGVNNIPIEEMETRAAFDIATNRYWDATWGNNIPAIPETWKALGITDDQAKQIYKIALDSPNIETFNNKLLGEVVLPAARSTLQSMLDNNYDDVARPIIQDTLSKMPWMVETIDRAMESGNPTMINAAFDQIMDNVTNDYNWKNAVQIDAEFDNLKNRFAMEGFSAVGTAWEAISDMYTDIMTKTTKQEATLFVDRVVKAIDEKNFTKQYEALHNITQNDYNIARGYAIKFIGAAIEGLGINSDVAQDLMLNVMKQFDIQKEYFDAEHQLYQKYAREKSKDYDWDYYKKSKLEMLDKQFQIQLDSRKEMNKIMVDYLRNNSDPKWSGHIDGFEKTLNEIIQKKEAYNKGEIESVKKRMAQKNNYDRATESIHQMPERQAKRQEIHSLEIYAAQQMKAIEKTMTNKPIQTKQMSLEDTLRLELFYEEAQRSSKNTSEFLKHYEDKSDPKKVFDPISFENTNVKTSFREYADQQFMAKSQQGAILVDYSTLKAEANTRFNAGEGVPLGASANAYGNIPLNGAQIGTEFKLINPKADVSSSEYMMARSQPFYHGNDLVNAGVYRNGHLIGYITAGMQETVDIDGKTFPVIGMSKTDPSTYLVMVDDKVWRVKAGEPRNVDFSIFAKDNFHPYDPNSAPTTQPWGKAALEASPAIREAINLWRQQALSDLSDAQNNGSFFSKFTDEQRVAIFNWMESDLRQAYNSQRFRTQRFGDTMVDATLLNYSRRYGIDNALTMIMPYQFWMTRSVLNWGARMLSQPQWFSMYARLEKMIERNKRTMLPSRLDGTVYIPMSNMGDGMGSGFFIDPMGIMFPFKQFYEVGNYWISNLQTIDKNTRREIEYMYNNKIPYNGKLITDEEYQEALLSRGDLYKQVFEEQRAKDESDTSIFGLLDEYLKPSLAVQAIYNKLSGNEKGMSYTPMYRFGNTIRAAGDETPVEGLTNVIGNALQMTETKARQIIGLDSDPMGGYGTNYKDYYITSILANMVTEREISKEDARIAIAQGEGNENYDEAERRLAQQLAIRQQGGGILVEGLQSLFGNKKTSAGQLAGTAYGSLFGMKVYPEGEAEYRQVQQEKNTIAKMGDKDEWNRFYDNHPDYEVHQWAYEDDPDEKLHKVLVSSLNDHYWDLPESQKIAVQRAFGDEFEYYFLNKDTRSTDEIDDETIIRWIRGMDGQFPDISDSDIEKPMQEAQQVQWYADSVQGKYDRYKYTIKTNFAGIDTIEDGYYAIPSTNKSARKQYLQKYPQLQSYWDYKDSIRRSDPELSTYIMQRSAHYSADVYHNYDSVTEALMNNVNDYAVEKIENYIKYGWKIPAETEAKLRATFTSLGITNMTYDTWKKSLVNQKSK